MKWRLLIFIFVLTGTKVFAQIPDSVKNIPIDSSQTILLPPPVIVVDTPLRILNLNPFISLQVDSILNYKLELNKDSARYFWYLKNSPVGLRINKDNGLLYMNVEKALFRSGRLKYDVPYEVQLGVQNVVNLKDRVDTSFTIQFYSTDIIVSKLKTELTTNSLFLTEGDSTAFRIYCEPGTFPIESITTTSTIPVAFTTTPAKCGEVFSWSVPFDFIKEGDTTQLRTFTVQFVGTDKFYNRDTANIRISVRNGTNYPLRYQEYSQVKRELNRYIATLKYTFKKLDKKIKSTKTTRTTFDLTAASTALGGTIISSTTSNNRNSLGKVLPGVGVAMVPVKEAVAPQKNQEQNTTTQLRSVIKRLEYLQIDNALIGNRDPDVANKIKKMKDELKQAQLQLIDVPLVDAPTDGNEEGSPQDVNEYFNDPKVNKKYRTLKK